MLKVKDFVTAIKRIKENPNNHGFSKEDYEAIISLDKSLKNLFPSRDSHKQRLSVAGTLRPNLEPPNPTTHHKPLLLRLGWEVCINSNHSLPAIS